MKADSMKVAIIQSSFIPWRGYFDIINSVDKFVFLEDVQYTKRDWRNRNRIKTPHGSQWLQVPVDAGYKGQTIMETMIARDDAWVASHSEAWHRNYKRAPYFRDVLGILEALRDNAHGTISSLNIALTKSICSYLQIETELMSSVDIPSSGTSTAKLISILKSLNATCYLSGPSAKAYIEIDLFRQCGIELHFKSYVYAPYPQLWGDFIGGVTILDLIANCGPRSSNFLSSAVL